MGFRTAIERFPRDKTTVVILCNRTDLDACKLALQAPMSFFGSGRFDRYGISGRYRGLL
jgi:hypothetical protein